MRSAVASTCFSVLLALALSGCGGGGDGGGDGGASGYGNNLPPSTGSGDTENFIPVATGDAWSYHVTASGFTGGAPPASLSSVTVMVEVIVRGFAWVASFF